MQIVLFEDNFYKNLYPLTILRASFEIKNGFFTLKERAELISGKKYEISLHCRNAMSDYLSEVYPSSKINLLNSEEDCLFLNGRVNFSFKTLKWLLKNFPQDTYFASGDTVIAAKVPKEKLIPLTENENIKSTGLINKDDLLVLNLIKFAASEDVEELKEDESFENKYPWDTIKGFSLVLKEELAYVARKFRKLKGVKKNVKLVREKNIFIESSAKIYPYSILDGNDGEIYVGENTVIEPFTYIKGPAYIGNDCVIKSGTKLYGPVSIGEHSKVSGEIANSIFHSYVNKQHDGFIGHSYLCPFVNAGADTVTSNLKNNYSPVSVIYNRSKVNTKLQFLGTIAGDHTKFGINTMLNTGTIAGVFANVAGGGFPEKNIGSFTWNVLSQPTVKYKVDEAIRTAKSVVKRRGLEISEKFEKLLRDTSETEGI